MKVSFQIKLFVSRLSFLSAFALLGGYYYVDVSRQLYQEMSARAQKYRRKRSPLIPSLRKKVEQKDINEFTILCRK